MQGAHRRLKTDQVHWLYVLALRYAVHWLESKQTGGCLTLHARMNALTRSCCSYDDPRSQASASAAAVLPQLRPRSRRLGRMHGGACTWGPAALNGEAAHLLLCACTEPTPSGAAV